MVPIICVTSKAAGLASPLSFFGVAGENCEAAENFLPPGQKFRRGLVEISR
jgi:hypothetical protein